MIYIINLHRFPRRTLSNTNSSICRGRVCGSSSGDTLHACKWQQCITKRIRLYMRSQMKPKRTAHAIKDWAIYCKHYKRFNHKLNFILISWDRFSPQGVILRDLVRSQKPGEMVIINMHSTVNFAWKYFFYRKQIYTNFIYTAFSNFKRLFINMAVFKGFPGLTFQKVKFKYFKHYKHLVRTLNKTFSSCWCYLKWQDKWMQQTLPFKRSEPSIWSSSKTTSPSSSSSSSASGSKHCFLPLVLFITFSHQYQFFWYILKKGKMLPFIQILH